jgi:BirA family transcriptional regulator, biotin operon repressor / biotin---[acetyl-CoA-carboxylase] ligase
VFNLSRILNSALVRHVDHHESIGSTSDQALELAARDGAPLPLLVLTERQTGGRGRGTNRWWSADGALTFSLVLDAAGALPPEERPRVALVAGLAVCEALAELAPSGTWQVKWPNDVFAGGGKVCGILCESVPGWPERLVVGIGINVNNACREQRTGDTVQETQVPPLAAALIDLDGLPRDLTDVLLAVLDRLDLRWRDLAGGDFPTVAAEYRRRCFLTGKTLRVTSGAAQHVGLCRGIDDCGALVLATETGSRTIVAGSVDAWE